MRDISKITKNWYRVKILTRLLNQNDMNLSSAYMEIILAGYATALVLILQLLVWNENQMATLYNERAKCAIYLTNFPAGNYTKKSHLGRMTLSYWYFGSILLCSTVGNNIFQM